MPYRPHEYALRVREHAGWPRIEVGHRPGHLQGDALPLYPPNRGRGSYYRDTWSYGQLVYQKQAMEEMSAFRAQIKGWMVRGEVEGQPKMSVADADRIVHERLDQCYVTRSPMWMPGVSLSMIGWTHARELKARMTVSLPGARFGGMLVYPRYLTLEFRFHALSCRGRVGSMQDEKALRGPDGRPCRARPPR